MDKKRLKVALVVLDAVKSIFLETQEFIENTSQEECEREDYCRRSNFLQV